jgi:hypothetical protein
VHSRTFDQSAIVEDESADERKKRRPAAMNQREENEGANKRLRASGAQLGIAADESV